MKTLVRTICLFFPLAILFLTGNACPQDLSTQLFVKPERENLREAPGGKVLGQLLKDTEVSVLVEQNKWVKVQVTGWIWKESLTKEKPPTVANLLRAFHIMVKTRAEAEAILQQLREGANFEELAKKKSIGPSAARGGDLGYFKRGDFAPEFDEAISKLQVGEISGVVETSTGFHIFKRAQ